MSLLKFGPNILNNQSICPSRSFSLATVLVITVVIPEERLTKNTFKTKNVNHYQNQESTTRKQCTPMRKGIVCVSLAVLVLSCCLYKGFSIFLVITISKSWFNLLTTALKNRCLKYFGKFLEKFQNNYFSV